MCDLYASGLLVRTRGGKVIGLLVRRPVDELPQAGHRVGAHQGVAAERPAVHHSDVQRRMEQLVLGQILQNIVYFSNARFLKRA